jgi:cysteine desulfurase/selenocysteine lyase
MKDIREVRRDFPQLRGDLIYLDSASTSLKPKLVIDAVRNYDEKTCANVGRGLHRTSFAATGLYEEAHKKVKKFLNADGEVIFTKNCTEAINLVASGLAWKAGDEVIATYLEHNSNFLPWLRLRNRGVKLRLLKCDAEGQIDFRELERAVTRRTKLVAMTQASNVIGTIVPIEKAGAIARKKGFLLLVDGAQSAPHLKVDLRKMGCHFFAASGHKMLGPSGTGFLAIDKNCYDRLEPLLIGGGTVTDVFPDHYLMVKTRERFEGGTPNISGGIGLGYAVDYLAKIGMDKVRKHEIEMTGYAHEQFMKVKGMRIHGTRDVTKKMGLVSFAVKDISSHRLAVILDELGGIAIRSGLHCAFLLIKEILKEPKGTARASFYIYNTKSEIDKCVEVMKDIV